MLAAKAGHDNVKEKLQPVRQNLESHMPRIHSVKLFKEARAFVRAYGLQRLKHEMGAPAPQQHRNRLASHLNGNAGARPGPSPTCLQLRKAT